jgi:uncharacterized membrane protein
MNRDDAIDLLYSAGVDDDRIDEQAILIASIVGTVVIRAFVRRLAERIVADVVLEAEYLEG